MATAAQPLVSRVNAVYLYVSNMERSLRFYRDLLGMPMAGDEHWQEATLGGTRFALHETHEGLDGLSSGTVRIDLEVADVGEAAERLREAGVEVRRTVDDEWGSIAEIVDPDGYLIELFQPPS